MEQVALNRHVMPNYGTFYLEGGGEGCQGEICGYVGETAALPAEDGSQHIGGKLRPIGDVPERGLRCVYPSPGLAIREEHPEGGLKPPLQKAQR